MNFIFQRRALQGLGLLDGCTLFEVFGRNGWKAAGLYEFSHLIFCSFSRAFFDSCARLFGLCFRVLRHAGRRAMKVLLSRALFDTCLVVLRMVTYVNRLEARRNKQSVILPTERQIWEAMLCHTTEYTNIQVQPVVLQLWRCESICQIN